jgi:hypothetical protein
VAFDFVDYDGGDDNCNIKYVSYLSGNNFLDKLIGVNRVSCNDYIFMDILK